MFKSTERSRTNFKEKFGGGRNRFINVKMYQLRVVHWTGLPLSFFSLTAISLHSKLSVIMVWNTGTESAKVFTLEVA